MDRSYEDRLEAEREAGDLGPIFRRARERTALVARPDDVARLLEPPRAAGVAPWLRAAGVLFALALGIAGLFFMGGERSLLLAEVRRIEGSVSLDRAERVEAGSRLRVGDVLQCQVGTCTLELSTGCVLVLSEGTALRLDLAADGSLRLTLMAGTLDYWTSLPRAFVCIGEEVLKCEGPDCSLRAVFGPGVEVRSGCVMARRDVRGSESWNTLPCGVTSCSTKPFQGR